MKIPFSPPYIDQSVIEEVTSCLKSGWITSGPKVKALESAIAEYVGIKNIICVNSWTSGAIMILKWLGIQEGDEVIIPAYTYSATALAVLHCGAKPIMVDIQNDLNIDVKAIRNSITSRTKAIIPVDIAGWPCDYEKIVDLIKEKEILNLYKPATDVQQVINRILIIADAAHSFGATKSGKPAISYADVSIFSLHAVKNLTTAEGGAICINLPEPFNNNDLYNHFKMMTLNGQTKDAYTKSVAGGWKYDIMMQGFKINMPDICAAIGLAQVRIYDYILAERKRVFYYYTELFKSLDWIELPPTDNDHQSSSYHLYAIRIKDIVEKERDKIIEEISRMGIGVNVHFIPLPMLTLFKDLGYDIKLYPKSYENYSREISLPIYPQLPDSQIRYIVSQISKIYKAIILK